MKFLFKLIIVLALNDIAHRGLVYSSKHRNVHYSPLNEAKIGEIIRVKAIFGIVVGNGV